MMDNCTKFSDLTAHLRELFKSASYSESTVKDMDFILQAFSDCMDANGLDDYSPEMGEILIRYCEETLKVCTSRVTRAKIIVSKLNRLFQGLDGEEALWAGKSTTVELPDSLLHVLDSFISHCRNNGNKDTTLRYKRWICGRFLKNLENLGCSTLSDLSGELIQTAFLQLGYLRYWERIGPFLRYLFESGQVQRDFSKLVIMHEPEAFLFPGRKEGSHYTTRQMDSWFSEILKLADIDQRERDCHERGACLHCFRHLFVLKSMQQLEAAGHSVDMNDLLLPTYLGHECLLDTDKYMRFSGGQVAGAIEAFESFTSGLIPDVEVPYEEE